MHRSSRQQAILDIIAKYEIETQEELCDRLNKMNFNVTQATVSRDIKELGLYKVNGITKKYKYAYVEPEEEPVADKMQNLFKNCTQSITSANNIIVVKTMRGNGSTAGTFVDSLCIEGIIGCVAGDDTLLIIVDSNERAPYVQDILREYMM
ncbi:MAG: arginine repressor [Clostridia bacterium]|nr:arginine repressor [Clostridia bacterium]